MFVVLRFFVWFGSNSRIGDFSVELLSVYVHLVIGSSRALCTIHVYASSVAVVMYIHDNIMNKYYTWSENMFDCYFFD